MKVYSITEEIQSFYGQTCETITVDHAVCRSKENAKEKSKQLLMAKADFAEGWACKEIDYDRLIMKLYDENGLCIALKYWNYELDLLD